MFELFQSKRSKQEPVHLYEIIHGSGIGERMYLTDAEFPITVDGATYQVTEITHSEIKTSGTLDNASVELRCPFQHPLTRVFLRHPPDRTTTLVIKRGEANDAEQEFLTIWSGRILSFSVDNIESKFSCEPIATATRRPGLRRNFQYGCPHVLYGPQCRANKAARTTLAHVEGINASVITLSPGWSIFRPARKHLGGLMEWSLPGGVIITRTVINIRQDPSLLVWYLTLSGEPTGLSVGQAVNVAAGCDHQIDDCRNLHNNILNYGGQPWIPLKNPVGNYNNFY